mgnify:CR=1 FL=1
MRYLAEQKNPNTEKPPVVFSLSQEENKPTNQDYLNDILLLNVIQLFSKLIKFDILRLTQKQELFYTAVNLFVRILEYDQKNIAYSYLLDKQRSKKNQF